MVLFLMSIKSKGTDYLQKKQSKNESSEESKKEREETSFEISSLVSGCGEVTDYRTFMEDFRKCAEFVKWLKEKTEG